MKPLLLHGHDRPITQIKYNREGDLLFSASKGQEPNVWYSVNGERLGTFNGHSGAVWTIDVNWDTTRFMSGAADNTVKLWDCETGVNIGTVPANSSVRTCAFSYSATMAVYSTDKHYGFNCEIHVIDVRNADNSIAHQEPILKLPVTGPRVTSAVWGILDETVITGHEDGVLRLWDLRSCKERASVSDHTRSINDMQLSKDGTMFITASKDHTSKLFDTDTLMCLKCYKTDRPCNSAAISPIKNHVVLGGGQEAMDVTTTSTRSGKFESRFFHLIFEEEFARVKGHFGPINSVAFHPDGRSFSTGGEDGYVRIQSFDQSYFDFTFDC
ncbi:eukaryotic translation initiation factor 3 subunit I [Schistocerca gregaria]|uniref:eukaryotic translation initiation factor 3 subunit I n=1 Tax=Schistocerca gregaria TaxID=7010 RepID=UPI00211F0B33|nr:eukaryotic translation initiation factor 3 subunit I [Schistocerca gregaria]